MARKPAVVRDLAALAGLRDELERTRKQREQAQRVARAQEAERAREANLFRSQLPDVNPIRRAPTAEVARPKPQPLAIQHHADERNALAQTMSDEFQPETLLESDADLGWHRPQLGPDVVRKLRRGEWVIQDQLDLHGARSDEAREQLGEFLREALKRGLRCVRVVHGKGLGSPARQPVLKDKVKRWLAQREEVIAFCQARAGDGGHGALVVLLRPS
jgi:DNA-nicking Smr family endonuclease